MLLPLLRHIVPLNDGNCCLTLPIIRGPGACDALPHTFNNVVFKSINKNFAKIEHTYNESANIIKGCNVVFNINDCWNFP